ncbi:AGC family protein kinase [Trichomonas vaginalis G3]|uniref:non-specific serine/threonine protein kinase n=1 Tax=Trichomonas vaginalis (strain ATCC PRA-98 / G3) TaxID=412133 RepID=A2F8N5_TRIV3|nr:protein serine/threonine kinase protein [Trichomonas vaginalis G3]EAX98713.1 AGC family protein kinase [Trichomonas vaginalis G3]KAI5538506.1 protein serine/threonine kinase protein [Trichomonas vaginalis G3]|eukprot:XP_001311643.1 AGC family protein kinase [Trichomonas vaginalis G3]
MEKFKLVKEIGRGGYGRALLVRSQVNGELKVIKEINWSLSSKEEKEAALSELKILKTVNCDNIIKVCSAAETKGKLLILMEYADDGDLEKKIQSSNGRLFCEEVIIDFFTQTCLAVKYLHDRKLIHRDIKPANIFLCSGGIVKLGDFGLARTLDTTMDHAVTQVGTALYAAPEVLKGLPYSFSADCWGLGCVLYHLMAQRPPFLGETVAKVAKNVISQKVKIPSRYSDELREICQGLLEKDPKNRLTVSDVLNRPILRLKAAQLIGAKEAEIELGHTVFHGLPAGQTPQDFIRKLDEVRKNQEDLNCENVDMRFTFMGRPIGVDESLPPEKKAEFVRKFASSLVGKKRLSELEDMLDDSNREELQTHEEYLMQLLAELKEYLE